jgi:hypothetical protein
MPFFRFEYARFTRPTLHRARTMAALARARVFRTTFGTMQGSGPSLTTRETELPLGSCVPAAGLCSRTSSAGLEAKRIVTLPTWHP